MVKARLVALVLVLLLSHGAEGTVFINEVFINPPGATDDGREFIELLGTPGRKLDGYAVALLNGTEEKFYPLGSIPPIPVPAPEIDELFSLDGLMLGTNGILVLGIQEGTLFWYPTLLSDSNFARWTTLWNGGLDVPGQLGNNGSVTVMLVRNRPGRTEADPTNPAGLRWGKDIPPDAELITPVLDPQDGQWKDQWGDGNLDKGQLNGLGGNTLDMKGASTLGDITDDLEIVDEVSYEDGRGWEYDVDGRRVDIGSTWGALEERRVHTIGDPAGFNPDALSRVDYRTKGNGWAPAGGGSGELPNGNNWQDTATEQWIRGESTSANVPGEGRIGFFYVNDLNTNADAVQPYDTHVPLWLNDGSAPDYDFGSANTYEIGSGRINPLAVPFIPGDSDRDGDCDADDIAKIAAVFGDDDWIFSNSFADAPEGDSGDPATQTRPWDVDATGDNGIEAGDLQWTLNFQANTNGQIVGVRYDSTTPAATGVVLNPNTGVACTVTPSVNIPSGRTLSTLALGDIVEVTVSGEVTAGANTTGGEENGIMQYAHDVAINSSGILKATLIEPLGSFSTTRASLQTFVGTNGDLGVELVNGFTTSFAEGLAGPAGLYRVTLEAIGVGSADITVSPAAAAKFAAGTPHGVKVGHTDANGDPGSSVYPAPLSATVTGPPPVPGDFNGDGDVDLEDYGEFQVCFGQPAPGGCEPGDLTGDDVVDLNDYLLFAAALGPPRRPCLTDEDCDDGNPCTDDLCDPWRLHCQQINNDDPCEDGLFCNGAEVCSNGVCQPGSDPCQPTEYCNENIDACYVIECQTDPDCDDGNACTTDSCVEFLCINECPATVSSYPYLEDFEGGFGAWENLGGDDFDWTRSSGSTPSTGTGPSGDHTTTNGFYVYTEASLPNHPNKTALLQGPCFDLSGMIGADLTFWYHMYGQTMGTLSVEVSADCLMWATVWSLSGDQGDTWFEANVDLSAFAGATITIRFKGVTGSSWYSDMAIDDVSVAVTPG